MPRYPKERRSRSSQRPEPRRATAALILCLGATVLLAMGCDSESNPVAPPAPSSGPPPAVAPTPPPSVPPPSPPGPDPRLLSGTVVETVTGRTVSGATVATEDASAKTDETGRFDLELESAPAGVLDIEVSANGFVTRNALVGWQPAGRTGVVLDIIEERAPFDLGFYREIARNGFEAPSALRPLRTWPGPETPRFYLRLEDDRGSLISDQEVQTITRTIRQVVPVLTGGRFTSVVIESGRETRPAQDGWIRVLPLREADDFCGRATVGALAGTMQLVRTGCGCTDDEKITPGVVAHEVAHALGFWHIGADGLMNATADVCRSGSTFSTVEVIHANVAYTRERANRDPDVDPKGGVFAQAFDSAATVSCFPPAASTM